MSTTTYRFFTHQRKSEVFSVETLAALVRLEEKIGDNGCSAETGYCSSDATSMLYVSRSNDEENWEVCGKLEYAILKEEENGYTTTVAKINWLCADKCGQVLYNRFKALVAGYAKKLALVCSLNEAENQMTVMCRLNFWTRNKFRARHLAYSSPDNDEAATCVNIHMETLLNN